MKYSIYILTLLLLIACNPSTNTSTVTEEVRIDVIEVLDALTTKAIADIDQIVLDSTAIPRTIEDGQLKGTKSKSWTSGFYPGVLWQLYGYSSESKLKDAAEIWTSFVEKEKHDDGTHDLGFKVYCPYGNAYKITQDDQYKDVFVTAGNTLSTRYSDTVKAIRSWDFNAGVWKYPVIIDNMMNLELIFETAHHSGDNRFYDIANNHATTTLNNHFRPDHSSYHVIDYDPETGEVANRHTHQGLSHESAWSRGQAWGLYGFTVAYRYTQNELYLQQAMKIADFFFNHNNLPEDNIPYWDFDVTDENAPRDVSAAAIAASGLLELLEYVPDQSEQYLEWAEQTITSIGTDKYRLDTPPFFLQHSTGSVPGEFEIDSPIIYAEYYYVEALLRLKKIYQL